MKKTAAQWSDYLGGILEGDGSRWVERPASIEESKEGTISFIAHKKFQHLAYTSHAAALIVPLDMQFDRPVQPALIRVQQPYVAFAQVLEAFARPEPVAAGIHSTAVVDPSASVSATASIGPGVVIAAHAVVGERVQLHGCCYVGERCRIGDDTTLYPGVVVYRDVEIGSRCIIHAGTVIGSDGFGFAPLPNGSYRKIPQQGHVLIEDEVEIGANCTIDRATLGATIIRQGAKLDNLIHVAHNVEIGARTVIAAQAGIAGSTRIGEQCQIGGQAGIVGHLTIAANTRINAQSGVTKSVAEPGRSFTGSPAYEYTASLRAQSLMRHLPDLVKRLHQLEQQVIELQRMLSEEKLT
ncbi:MAG: UDP-3-O-(3-hydroxymyristoyl)glucosamine N-acyltransferase [Chitinophagales bacterium]|nr:UDP-3-O-(3-hydroxymyristoyl)glucosamine N-acyltransferase [Chitinophagales bacterium]MDW8394327.1 UDP-3-O-(3-hydroxymyristoyl)glucosamine N-acyltransferase [Chitinophagales bacterium]